MIYSTEIGDYDRDWKSDDKYTTQGTNTSNYFARYGFWNHVTVPVAKKTEKTMEINKHPLIRLTFKRHSERITFNFLTFAIYIICTTPHQTLECRCHFKRITFAETMSFPTICVQVQKPADVGSSSASLVIFYGSCEKRERDSPSPNAVLHHVLVKLICTILMKNVCVLVYYVVKEERWLRVPKWDIPSVCFIWHIIFFLHFLPAS